IYCVYHCWTLRGHEIYLPPVKMALLQYAISCINWSLMAAIIWVLLGERIDYADVLTVLLIGAIAGVIAHVPAGLGVFEFVFVALLSHVVSDERLIGALLGYRAIYYILPLVIATALYLYMEVHAKQRLRSLPKAASAIVPASFMRLCEVVVLHHDPDRFALLYRLLWRLVHEPSLRNDPIDADMLHAHQMGQAVRRDIHKMKTLLKFREID